MRASTSTRIDSASLLRRASALTDKPVFSKEDSSRAQTMLDVVRLASTSTVTSERMGPSRDEDFSFLSLLTKQPKWKLEAAERRAIEETTEPYNSIPGNVTVPQGYGPWFNTLKATDAILDDNFTLRLPGSLAPMTIPILDPTSIASQITSEASPDPTSPDQAISSITLPSCPTFRTPIVVISNESLQDSKVVEGIVSTMAISQARGVGPYIINNLLSKSPVTVTATGSSKNTGGSETGGTSIGSSDLIGLRTSVDPAYRASGRCGWVMSDSTLAFLDGLLDKNGAFVFGSPKFDEDGYRLLLGYRVCLSPSMPSIGLNATPIAFGDLGRFAVRMSSVMIVKLVELYAETDQSAFRCSMRANGAVLIPASGVSPINLLRNAAS